MKQMLKTKPILKALTGLAALMFYWLIPMILHSSEAPNPLTDSRLAIVRPADFRDSRGEPAGTARSDNAVFDKTAVPVPAPVSASIRVRRPGTYTLWIRAGRARTGLRAELTDGSETILAGSFNDGPGEPARGGLEGWLAYRAKAVKNTPRHAAVPDLDSAILMGDDDTVRIQQTDTIADEFLGELQEATGAHLISLFRLEQPGDDAFYWWKIGEVPLSSGVYDLRIMPAGDTSDDAVPLVDAGFLTDFHELVYPYSGDIDAPRASYIRFRLTEIPEDGLGISVWLYTHMYAFPAALRTPPHHLSPSGITEEQERHVKTGYTPWYCLQDFEYDPSRRARPVPGLRYTREVGVNVVLSESEGVEGSTQFAVYPFLDSLVREIAWDEPGGRTVSVAMDFETYPHLLRTYRDHSREHYDFAMKAAGNMIFPLTRGALYLRASASAAEAYGTVDYVFKTMRLLGINKMNSGYDTLGMRARYGWWNSRGQARMQWFLPFDVDESRRQYEETYRFYADEDDRPVLEGVPVTYMVDEPGEGARSRISSPLWRYIEEPDQPPKWVDYPGRSELHTRGVEFTDCVLEGWYRRTGQWIEFRAATDSDVPEHFAFWRVGRNVAGENHPSNVMVGRDRAGWDRRKIRRKYFDFYSKAADNRARPGRFKIVYEKGCAALFLDDEMIYMHKDLPVKGGFGFSGDAKEMWDLRLRPIGKDEHIAAGDALAAGVGGGPEIELARELGLDTPAWAAEPKPLREWVEQDWVVSGGMPEAHAGFRKWTAAQGLEPELFGAERWEDVRPLTIHRLVRGPSDARRLYWGRRYSSYLTPKMFALAMDGIRANFPRKDVMSVPALSGGSANIQAIFPMDMFALASYDNGLMPGISDWHTHNAESSQVNAFSAAMFNAGARRYGQEPASISFMHCVSPSLLRTYSSFGNNVKYISFYTFGPMYADSSGWSGRYSCYPATSLVNNRVGQADDLAAPGLLRPSRVALLYCMSTEYWGYPSMADKRASFLALSHEYYQPEIVTEEQVGAGALEHYDALYVLDRHVAEPAAKRIEEWVRAGGLLWICADAATRNEYDEPADLLAGLTGLRRTFEASRETGEIDVEDDAVEADEAEPEEEDLPSPIRADGALTMLPVDGETGFTAHTVHDEDTPVSLEWEDARVRALYDDGRPAWVEKEAGLGKVVYIAHRAGMTYADKVIRARGRENLWSDIGRATLVQPLREAGIERELVLSEPLFLASPLSADGGTLIVLYNMRPVPVENVELKLRETNDPHSVEIFDGLERVPLSYRHENGWVKAELPAFEGGQMIIVRRTAPPDDGREDELRARTGEQLGSEDWKTLSAGIFMAGFRPGWGFADRLIPFLSHPRWEVRRQAAESLGRLGHDSAADAILEMARTETDAHARGDGLAALARLGRDEARALCLDTMEWEDAFAKQKATEAARLLVFGEDADSRAADAGLKAFGLEMAEKAVLDRDLRVRTEGIRLMGLLDADRLLDGALGAFVEADPDILGQPVWAEALAENGEALEEYIRRGLPGGKRLLLALSAQARRAELADALSCELETMRVDEVAEYVSAMLFQRDPGLTGKAFELRAELPESFGVHLTYILESTFGARLGKNLEKWNAWLARTGSARHR